MVVFVIGPAGSGKSTYISKFLSDYKKIDLFDFQNRYICEEAVWESYYKCRDALVKAIQENENVVLEHTLLKSIRRPMYIDAVREVYDGPIDVVCIIPAKEELAKRRSLKFGKTVGINSCWDADIFEMPKNDDGFRNITVVDGDF